jgi:hypothetical protein
MFQIQIQKNYADPYGSGSATSAEGGEESQIKITVLQKFAKLNQLSFKYLNPKSTELNGNALWQWLLFLKTEA